MKEITRKLISKGSAVVLNAPVLIENEFRKEGIKYHCLKKLRVTIP
jgi:hypothetical protein